jgi:hypothetical protein
VSKNASVLFISDMHHPYAHPDWLRFLKYLKKKYNPDRVICLGDELDFHAISFHDSNPNLLSPSDELELAVKTLQPLYELFPKMDIIESNHGSLVYRKGDHHGIPRTVFKSYREILGAPIGWKWHFDLTIRLSNGTNCYIHHGKSANGLKLSQSMGMCTVQGHYHESFGIEYWANPLGLFWHMQCACLVDNHSLAFNYNKTNLKRPIIGTGLAINGLPVLEPMVLDSTGRWIGRNK